MEGWRFHSSPGSRKTVSLVNIARQHCGAIGPSRTMPVAGLTNSAPRHQAFVVRRKLRKPSKMEEKREKNRFY
jgi:hypothetical protein